MNENNKSFYPSNMFEFIHHPEYGCHDLKGLNPNVFLNQNCLKTAPIENKVDCSKLGSLLVILIVRSYS
jgi:hypothetical protein